MSAPSAEEIIEAFVDVLRDRLENGKTTDVPGLGTFSVEHHPSKQKEGPDGNSYMAPPRDVVRFDPEE